LIVLKKIGRLWSWLVGDVKEFSLITRIFHSICLICILALIYNIPLNAFVGLPVIAAVSAGSLLLVTGIYLLSRFKKQTGVAITAFCAIAIALFTINFFLNSGVNGPTDLFFLLVMVVMVAILPVKRYWLAVSINVLILVGLHYIQFTNGKLVPWTYKNPSDRYIDLTSAYITVVSLVLLTFYILRRNYEIERRSAEEKAVGMKVLDGEKNKLLSIISHDLRAPLSNIQNYLELLGEIKLSSDERLEIEGQLLRSTRSTLELLNNVLSWSKSQMEGIQFNVSAVNVYEMLVPHLHVFSPIAQGKHITLDIAIEQDVDIIANGEMFQLVVRNLVNNAIKFTSAGGTIQVSAISKNGQCIITVKDSGNGKPVQLAEDIFLLNSNPALGTADEKGAGLGLVLCKQFTEAQNGKIWFQCAPDSGATFFVALPIFNKGISHEHDYTVNTEKQAGEPFITKSFFKAVEN
jgi:two-component system sensor histidine kinase/response regulator